MEKLSIVTGVSIMVDGKIEALDTAQKPEISVFGTSSMHEVFFLLAQKHGERRSKHESIPDFHQKRILHIFTDKLTLCETFMVCRTHSIRFLALR
jgi:hypothetical protein